MFNQHHTHYMSSSKIIPCSCKGNVITSTDGNPIVLKVKLWETQWHECIDSLLKVPDFYMSLNVYHNYIKSSLHLWSEKDDSEWKLFCSCFTSTALSLTQKLSSVLPSVFKCGNNSSWTTYVMNNTPDMPKQPYLTSWEGEHQRLSTYRSHLRMQTDCLNKNINSGRFK